MATILKRGRTVMAKTEVFLDGTACFEQQDDPAMPRPIRTVFIPKEFLEELGNPDVITVTVQSGIKE